MSRSLKAQTNIQKQTKAARKLNSNLPARLLFTEARDAISSTDPRNGDRRAKADEKDVSVLEGMAFLRFWKSAAVRYVRARIITTCGMQQSSGSGEQGFVFSGNAAVIRTKCG